MSARHYHPPRHLPDLIRLFRVRKRTMESLSPCPPLDERSLHQLLERHLQAVFGVIWLASQFSTGSVHGGRIDTLGIDDMAAPVIIEYKRTPAANLINQGLFYLGWLQDHQAEFRLLVQTQLDAQTADLINWAAPRLICVAPNFHRYDLHAVHQIQHRIELVRYRWFGKDLLMFDEVARSSFRAQRPIGGGDSRATMLGLR